MIIRRLEAKDITHLRELHYKYFSEFDFPDFSECVAQFGVFDDDDDDDDLIIGGGVRKIAETMIITDLNKSRIKIGKALIEAHRASIFACARIGVSELHAFVENEEYAKHLIKHGFSPRSRALSMRLPNG